MKKQPLFQQFERQAEEESKIWKLERMQELIKQLGPENAEISPPERKETGKTGADDH